MNDAEQKIVEYWLDGVLKKTNLAVFVGVLPARCKDFITDKAIAAGFVPLYSPLGPLGPTGSQHIQISFIPLPPPC